MTDYRTETARVRDPRYPLFQAYLHRFETVKALYDYCPHDPASYRERARELAGFTGDRAALAAVLEEYNRSLGAPEESLAGARTLATAGTVVVIGGQQPGVLTGPLYTFWKAVAVLQLTRALRRLLPPGAKVVPVFWIGAEDHDLAEVAPVNVQTPDGKVARLVYDPGPGYAARTSVGFLPAGAAASALVNAVEPTLWKTEFKDRVVDLLRRTAADSANLGEWFGRLLLALLGREGLVVANPLLPGIRALQGPIFREMIARGAEVAEAFQAGQDAVRRLGFEPQVEKDPDAANLYLYRGIERVPLYRRAPGRFAAGSGPDAAQLSEGELLELASSAPERLSPNVVLRPVAQDAVFPVLAYVGGPGEVSYFGLGRGVYRCFGRRQPVIYPRPSVTLVEPAVGRHLARCGLDPGEAADLDHLRAKVTAYLSEADPVGIDQAFARVTDAVRKSYDGLSAAITTVDPSLGDLVAKNLARVSAEVDWLRRKTWQQHRQNCRDAVRRYEAIETSFRPRGDYQERVYNIFPYLAKYGPALAIDLARLLLVPEDLSVETGHRFVWLSPAAAPAPAARSRPDLYVNPPSVRGIS